ncbi:MAG: hypothetical protein LBH01_02020 [Verrucomicrobiales bacterium]|jgi:hypothetical protein|nr:hypothetical protein [Verrucomicrobiales bacterium]
MNIENSLIDLLVTVILSGMAGAAILFVWFDTHAWIEYAKLFRLAKWLKVAEFEKERQTVLELNGALPVKSCSSCQNKMTEPMLVAGRENYRAAMARHNEQRKQLGMPPLPEGIDPARIQPPSYLQYLNRRHGCFLVRLVSCPICLGFWLAVPLALVWMTLGGSWLSSLAGFLPVFFCELAFYFFLKKLP